MADDICEDLGIVVEDEEFLDPFDQDLIDGLSLSDFPDQPPEE